MKITLTSKMLLASVFLSLASVSGVAMAQTSTQTTDPGHPRVNEIDNRLQDQQNRVNAGEAAGKITPTQAARDDARDEKVSNELSADQAKNNGHITKAEQRKMNRQLNRNSKKIHKQKKSATPTAQ